LGDVNAGPTVLVRTITEPPPDNLRRPETWRGHYHPGYPHPY
jgi:hypothetical protein